MKPKSIYKLASEAGVPIGLYLMAALSCFFFSLRLPFLQNLLLPLTIVFPLFLAMLMKHMVKQNPAYCHFYPLWLYGIYSVIFGALISMLYSCIVLMYIEPHFLMKYANSVIETLQQQPMAGRYEDMVMVMQKAIEKHQLPSTTEFITTLGWTISFSGSILSLLLAPIMSRMTRRQRVSMFR